MVVSLVIFLPVLIMVVILIERAIDRIRTTIFKLPSSNPFTQYTRKDTVKLLDEFIAQTWESADDFDGFCRTEFQDPLMYQLAQEWGMILLNMPPSHNDWQRLTELRDLLMSDSTHSK